MKYHYNWQSFVLAMLLVIVLPAALFSLRVDVLQMSTSIMLSPVILGAALVCGAGGFWCARKFRWMPLCTGIAWLLWFLVPVQHGGASSIFLFTAVLWGFSSVPAAAEFFANRSFKRQESV